MALDLTRDQLTEYDQAAELESYLHTYPYTLDLPSPPPNRDVVDYFLFDLQRGYCDYYASAMVVMARAIGLPARLVIGYSSGIYDSVNDYYIVTAANAHAWVEIYFSGIGWVEFEPTASFPTIQRMNDQAGDSEIPQIRAIQPFTPLRWLDSIHQNWLAIFTATIGTLLLGIVLWVISDQWRLSRLSPSMTIVRLYQRLYRLGVPLIEGCHMGDTPFEFAYRVTKRLKMIRSHDHLTDYFQRGAGETANLVTLYTQAVYSPHPPELGDQKTAIKNWVHLRLRLWIAAKLDSLKRLSSKMKLDH